MSHTRNYSTYLAGMALALLFWLGVLCVSPALCAAPAQQEDIYNSTPQRHGGSVNTHIDPQNGDIVHSVTAPRKPQNQNQAPPIRVYPLIKTVPPADSSPYPQPARQRPR